MSFDTDAIKKDVTEGAKDKAHPDFSHLLHDIQDDAKNDRKKLSADVNAANAEIHTQGFPNLSISNNDGKLVVADSNKQSKETNANKSTETNTNKSEQNNSQSDENKSKSETQSAKGEIKRDGDKITEITYPDGKSAKMHYTNNELDDYTNRQGEHWVKEGDTWKQKNPDGTKYINKDGGTTDKSDEANTFHGTVTADQKTGDVTTVDDKGNTRVVHADGSADATDKEAQTTTKEKPDGSSITRNTDGQVTEITYPNGKTAKFEYDEKTKELNGYTDQDGRHWKKEEDGVWRQKAEDGKYVNSDGKETDKKEEAATSPNISVNKENGDITFDDGKNKKVVHADGKVDEDYQGRRTKIEVKDGKASHEVKKHDTLWAIAEDNFSRMHDGKKPSVKEIQAEMDRIVSRYNENHKGHEIKNKNRIPVGVGFDLS